MADSNAPDWYTPEPLAVTPSDPNAAVPDWYTPETPIVAAAQPAMPAPTHATEKPTGNTIWDDLNFGRTALTNAVAGVAGVPRAAYDGESWLANKLGLGKTFAAIPYLPAPTSGQVANTLFNNTAPEYQPSSTAGQVGMSAATAAAPALLGAPETMIPNAIRGAIAGASTLAAPKLGLPSWAGPIITTLGEIAGRKAVGVVAPSLASGVDANAGKIGNEVGPINTASKPAIPSLNLTVGQQTGDPNWLALDREMGNTPAAQQSSAAALDANQAVIKNTLGGVSTGPSGSDASVAQAANTAAAQTAAKTAAAANWAAVPPDVSVSTPSLRATLDQHVTGVTANGDDDLLPTAQISRIMSLPDNAPLSALQARRSRLIADASDASRVGQSNAARVIGGVAKIVGDHIDDENNIVTGNPADLDAYKAARAGTSDYYSAFGDDNKAGVQIPDITSGKIAPESTLGRVLPPGNEGNGTQSLSRLKMANGTGGGLQPARDYLVGKLKDAVESGPAAFGQVMKNYDYAFSDPDMFTPEQQQTFKTANDAMAQTYAKAAPGAKLNAPTYHALNGPSFATALYGNILGRGLPLLAKTTAAGLGSAAMKMAGLGGGQEIVGQLLPGEAAGNAMQGAMSNARAKIFSTLDQMRGDAVLAHQMQMKATAGNLSMAPRLRNMLKMLGLDESQALPGTPGTQPDGS